MTRGDAAASGSLPAAPGSGASPWLIARRELVALLDRAVDKPVTMISAPAGSGKSSLLRIWADRPGQERRIATLTVTPGQRDAQLFWLALLSAVRAATGTRAPDKPPATTPGFNGEAMVEKVLSEAAEARLPFVVVVDDLHELSSPEAVSQLASLLERLPPGVHAVLSARHDIPLRLHRLRLAGQLAEIRADRLRFTVDETRELLAACGVDLPAAAAATLHQRTEGWAAGLRLAALSLSGHPDPEGFVAAFSGSDRTVAEYLVAEMLERQPADVQRLLLRTSLLDRVNGPLADLLTGTTGSERTLLELEDAGAFVVATDSARTWFRYHRLFGDLLRLELRRTAPESVPELHRLAARWLGEHAQTAEAIHHLQAAGDWGDAARLLGDHALSLTLDGRGETVAALLHAIPTDVRDRGLAPAYAIADLNQLRLDEAAAHLAAAKANAAEAPEDRRQRQGMVIASLELLLARLRGHFEGIVEQVDALPEPKADGTGPDIALEGDLRALALMNLGVTEAWSMRLADSERHLLDGAALARAVDRPYLEVACLAHLGYASKHRSLALAVQRCEEAVALAERHGWEAEPVIAPALATLAEILILTGEFDRAEQWLKRAARAAVAESEPGLRLLLHMVSALLPAARGRLREALDEFTAAGRVQAEMAAEHALTSQVAAWRIATMARLGLLGEARATLSAVGGRPSATAEMHNAAAVVHLAERDPAGASRELQPVIDGTLFVNSPLTLVEAHVLSAFAHRELGDEQAVVTSLEEALDLAEADRLVLPFVMTGAGPLLEGLPPHRTSHAALVSDILDAVRDDAPPGRRQPFLQEELSPSELRVLRYLPTNLTRPEIAAELSVSPNTVSTHIRKIYAKIGATDRSSAVRRGRELGLLSSGRA